MNPCLGLLSTSPLSYGSRLYPSMCTRLQLVDDLRLARSGEEGRQPIVVLDDLVRDDTRRDLPRPAHHFRHAESALPVRVLLAPEGGHPGVGPGVHVRPVVGRVDDDRVLCDPELVQLVEQRAHDVVVVDHRVVVGRLPAPRLAGVLEHLVVDRLHPLVRQRPRVLDPLPADAAPARLSVSSSPSVAQECSTPRGPKRSRKFGKSSAGG
jgi:hypothetical protein